MAALAMSVAQEREQYDDGTEVVTEEREFAFLQWLRENGAMIDKLEWPSRATTSGVRGTVALQDIESGEPMLEIPQKMIIYPAVCLACEALQPVYHARWRFFQSDDDLIIAVFLMHERLQGKDSFWFPYLEVLPTPGGIGEWSHEEQLELQDRDLVAEARRRPGALKRLYSQVQEAIELSGLYPAQYSFELFKWAWMVIQSRAFGRRLPWTAMVPFADCLNHNNVQVKYALAMHGGRNHSNVEERKVSLKSNGDLCVAIERKVDEAVGLETVQGIPRHIDTSRGVVQGGKGDENENENEEEEEHEDVADANEDTEHVFEGKFQLFPTGKNRYAKGEEAFNSYGRRSNSFLLLEYGFCLENNEWDSYKLTVRLDPEVVEYEAKCALLRDLGLTRFKSFRLERGKLQEDLLAFMRLSVLDAGGVRALLASADIAARLAFKLFFVLLLLVLFVMQNQELHVAALVVPAVVFFQVVVVAYYMYFVRFVR
ncbi:Histone-lysine N-methyltransferase setd3 [Hondaea fermentalgiana]|uniref:Histone-lysine N-methyltransferase setd3 n=1 Tax=Hondaea fermentalgiana TaxID=2315210 RepID=A0A2R5GWH5_9STRA|nr:Histone-lysine N-methyltransferase setd3 [Hondaea fermentalgiana]|eukprot:GBG32761.1 Histone-lysine N-methyltransferase setd3 [Hondaea fermentalgiana]